MLVQSQEGLPFVAKILKIGNTGEGGHRSESNDARCPHSAPEGGSAGPRNISHSSRGG